MVFQKLFNEATSATKNKAENGTRSPTKKHGERTDENPGKLSATSSQRDESAGRKRKRKAKATKQKEIGSNVPNEKKTIKKQRTPVSQDAINLTNELKHLSQQKKLEEAMLLYRDKKNDNVRDSYHACLLIDCCSRCGDVISAEEIVNQLTINDVNTEIYTALMKGYVHGGKINKAMQLFRKMTKINTLEHQRANIRTLNTLLRGCMWTAAMVEMKYEVVGGVVTSEEAWDLYQKQVSSTTTPDASSYEYSITLLCQSLRTDEATDRIKEFQTNHNVTIKGKACIVGSDHTILETLAVSYLALGRAFALLGNMEEMWISVQRCLSAVRSSRNILMNETTSEKNDHHNSSKIVGGKQAWKNKSEVDENSSRMTSNVTYRTHRLSELETDAIELLKIRSNVDVLSTLDLVQRLTNNLIYFSGGGTTELTENEVSDEVSSHLNNNSVLKSSWLSFGLQKLTQLKKSKIIEKTGASDIISFDVINKIFKTSLSSPVDSFGKLNCETIFADNSKPLDIEIGIGFGDWIVKQAQDNPSRNYIGVELRADRVYQSFVRSTLLKNSKPLANICIVGSECGGFLRHRINHNSVSTVYANHPEPPTQTFGDDASALDSIISGVGKEPAHMLHSKTIRAIVKCLKKSGRIVVVTDNKSYAKLVAATFSKVIRQKKNLLRSVQVKELDSTNLHLIEIFTGNVCLYQGRPSVAIGHSNNHNNKDENGGSSYFDRLWRTGTGRHSEKHMRFVIVMYRPA